MRNELIPGFFVSGLAEAEWARDRHRFLGRSGREQHKGSTASVQLGLLAQPRDTLQGELILVYDTDDDRLEVDEALAGLERGDWELQFGRHYVPFGMYFSHFASGPLLEFGETRDTGVSLSFGTDDRFDVSLDLYHGRARDTGGDAHRIDWALAMETWPLDRLSFGLSYQSDLADSDARLLAGSDDRYGRKVAAASGYLLWEADRFELTAEVLGALGAFRELQRDRNRPLAWNLEFAHFLNSTFDWALRLEGSRELEDAPRLQYGASVSFRVRNHASLTLEFLRGHFHHGLAANDDDEDYRIVHRLGAQLSVAF